ncbi:F420-dependent glucose-6-phosphate dehydrogenase [Paraconexibacter sp. AEG42_29]|uniref:F420-dependent glucose-6-phosphate dehydrogenase n=1 Tax=Paraconexibacter sp. AEG42_29 TaxID=2997339 RepID=A0AAU7ARC0_9ACTN
MRHALFLAPFDALSEPALLVDLAGRAEAAGWDGFFLWDHITYRDPVVALADPWIALAAVAQATERLRLGPMITPPARRRPWKLAREVTTLDRLSAGRVTLGLGLGSDNSKELSGYGEELDARRRAGMLEESLDLLEQCWSGAPVQLDGEHYTVDTKPFAPRPVQDPRPPIWLASRGEAKRPLRRAARYEGWFPIELAGPDALRAGIEEIAAIRAAEGLPPAFDVACTTDDHEDHRPWAAAGATWWLHGFGLTPDRADVERTIAAGPPDD